MEQTTVVFEEVARLADAELIAGLARAVRADRSLTARLLVHLGEVDARGLFRERAWSSMFSYAVQELHLSESEAQVRITAARLGRRFPRVIALLAEGAVHLTAIKLLGPHLTEDNHVQVLERARGKCAREIERIVVELAPKPDVPSRMRKLPAPRAARGASSQIASQSAVDGGSALLFEVSPRSEAASGVFAIGARLQGKSYPATQAAGARDSGGTSPLTAAFASAATQSEATTSPLTGAFTSADPQPETAASPLTAAPARAATQSEVTTSSGTTRASAPQVGVAAAASGHPAREDFQLTPAPRVTSPIKPLSPGRYKVECTVGESTHAKLEQLKALMRRQVPDADKNLAIILERAVDLLLEKTLKSRWAQTPRARKSPTHAGTGLARDTGATAEHPRAATTLVDRARDNGAAERASSASTHIDGARDTGATAEHPRTATTRSDRACDNGAAERASLDSTHIDRARGTGATAEHPRRGNALDEREGIASQPRAHGADDSAPALPQSRYIPRSVVREVYARDGGQCTFLSLEGRRCGERNFLELHHHETPYARGGLATAQNLRIMCRTHNRLLAERDFGRAFMLSKLVHARLRQRDGANELVLRREPE